MNEALELYKANGLLVVNDQSKVTAKGHTLSSTTITLAKSKAIAAAFGIKGDAVALKQDEGGLAIKTAIGMEIGGLMTNPQAVGVSMKHATLANGNVKHTYTVVEQKAKSASETAIAAYLGMTVEEVRAARLKALAVANKPTIDVPSTSAPVAAPELTSVGV